MATDNVSITIDNDLDETEMSLPPVLQHSIMSRPSFEQEMATDNVRIRIANNSDEIESLPPSPPPPHPPAAPTWKFPIEVMATDNVSIPIGNDLDDTEMSLLPPLLPPAPSASSSSCEFHREMIDPNSWIIIRLPNRLREVNAEAYKPNVISIGPYGGNRYGELTVAMEVVKENCYRRFIEKTKRDRREFKEAMRSILEGVKKCYQDAGRPNLPVNWLVRDGFFIVWLILGNYPEENFCQLGRIQTEIRYDLLLFENQLPFFVLFDLYRMINPEREDAGRITSEGEDALDKFARLALSLFTKGAQRPAMWSEKYYPTYRDTNDIKHLLGLVHATCLPSVQGRESHLLFKQQAEAKSKAEAEAESKAEAEAEAKEPKSQRSWKFIRCATELEEAGIKFFGEKVQDKKNKSGVESLFDIEFTDDTKVLKIPTFHVDNNTERILRNLMAYEQSIPSSKPTYVCDYVTFMDNLINTGRDVQLLCNCGIIDNWLGDDEAVAQMFNKLRNNIYWCDDFYYAEIFGKVNEHCQRKWNKWMATLKRDYFNSPWSLISFLAAVFLLLFTAIQALFSVLSYVH